jgi:hypothetical protein
MGIEIRVEGLRFGVQCYGFRVQKLWIWVLGVGF